MKTRSLEQKFSAIRVYLKSRLFPAALPALKRVMSIAPLSSTAQFLLGEYF
jgi:hypothetical protein